MISHSYTNIITSLASLATLTILLNKPEHSNATQDDRAYFVSSVWSTDFNYDMCAPSLSSLKCHLLICLLSFIHKH